MPKPLPFSSRMPLPHMRLLSIGVREALCVVNVLCKNASQGLQLSSRPFLLGNLCTNRIRSSIVHMARTVTSPGGLVRACSMPFDLKDRQAVPS